MYVYKDFLHALMFKYHIVVLMLYCILNNAYMFSFFKSRRNASFWSKLWITLFNVIRPIIVLTLYHYFWPCNPYLTQAPLDGLALLCLRDMGKHRIMEEQNTSTTKWKFQECACELYASHAFLLRPVQFKHCIQSVIKHCCKLQILVGENLLVSWASLICIEVRYDASSIDMYIYITFYWTI